MMDLPDFYQADQVGELGPPRVSEAVQLGYQYDLTPALEDELSSLLLLVDAQVDFIHPEGALHVPGAVADSQRTVEWIYHHMDKLSAITASLDSHLPIQIFFPPWWVDGGGNHPDPYTAITAEQVKRGQWRPLYQPEWSKQYVVKLQQQAKKDLMIWPYHTMLGTQGHNLLPALYEAIIVHSAARKAQPNFVIKGTIANTEYYSLLEPEVKVPADDRGRLNNELLQDLLSYDRIYIAGQAKSHCVLATISSVMHLHGGEPEVVSKFNLLMDCTSSVQHPQVDFEAMAQATYQEYAERGLNIISSTDAY